MLDVDIWAGMKVVSDGVITFAIRIIQYCADRLFQSTSKAVVEVTEMGK